MKKILISVVASSILAFGAYNDSGTEYTNDLTSSFTEESSLQPLDTVNMILGMIAQTKSGHFVNKGPYKVLIKDEEETGEVQSTGASGTSNVEKLLQMTIIVTRKDENSPMIVKFWLDEDGDDYMPAQRIIGHIEVSQSVSNEYPYGKFVMNFGGFGINSDDTTNFNDKNMGGILNVNKGANLGQASVYFKNKMTEQGVTIPERLEMTMNVHAVDVNGDGDTLDDGEEQGRGVAYAKGIDWSGGTPSAKEYKLSLSNRFYRVEEVGGSEVVKDKNKVSHKVFKYGLYHEDNGSRVTINSGYPIMKLDSVTGKETHGYIGYHGLWAESNSITDGDTVYKENDREQTTAYTVVQAPGKLKKYTKSTVQMEKLDNTKMYYWNNTDATQYIITWDKTAGGGNGDFKVVGTQNDYGEADTNVASAGAFIFDTHGENNSSNPLVINEWNGAWSESLQANIPIKSDLSNDSNVSFHKEEVVVPTADMTLINFGHEVINPNMSDINDMAIQEDGTGNVIGTTYTFSSSALTLVDSASNPMVINSDINTTNTYRDWGMTVGPLVDSTTAASYNASNFWEIEQNEDVYYRWETGSKDWNKFSGIKLASTDELQTFDPPMVFNYEHNTAKDINGATDVNGTYSLQYDGFSLQIPWENVDGKWYPKINIKSATQLSLDSNNYRIKILDEGLEIDVADTSDYNSAGVKQDANYPDLVIPSDLSATDSNEIGFVHDDNKILSVGEKPLNVKVEVIKGECLEVNCGN